MIFLYDIFDPRDCLDVLIHKDPPPMYFATGSIMKTLCMRFSMRKRHFFQVMQDRQIYGSPCSPSPYDT